MKVFSPRGWAIALAAIALALSAQPAKASFWTFSDSSNRAASADFSLSGNTLTITLQNTASVAPSAPSGVFTAIFFDYSGPGSITFNALNMGHSAAVASGAANYSGNYGGFGPNDIGGEWAFRSGVNNFSYGLSSTGLGDFGPGDRFNNNDLSPPASPDGPQWGIVNSTFTNGNGGVSDPMVQDTATFTFTVNGAFDVNAITRVFFLYGTAYGEAGGDGGGGGGNAVPAPAGLILLASAVPVFAFRRLIRRKQVAA